jgi:hypothetical protein
MKTAQIYSPHLHGTILGKGEGGALHARALLESPQRAMEVMGPFFNTLLVDPNPFFNAIMTDDDELEMMALPDLLVLFLKAITAAAASLRRRIHAERMLLLNSID